MINEIILTLGIKVIFSENPGYTCGSYYPSEKMIEINLASFCDQNDVLYHELGHALFLKDQEVRKLIAKYPAPRFYYSTDYPTESEKLDEKVADYFLMKMKYSDFSNKFKKIDKLFNDKLSSYERVVK